MTPEDQLRDAMLRVTSPRVAVLTEVHAHPHSDVDTLIAKVRTRLGSVSTQAVYDVLRALTNGFVIDEAEVTYWGVCPTCQQSIPSRPSRKAA